MIRKKLSVTAAVILRGKEILAAKRKLSGSLGGYWEFPGGKIEPGETPEVCLARELKEELGLAIAVGAFFMMARHSYPAFDIELHVYWANFPGGDFALTAHEEVAWAKACDLPRFTWAPADLPIVAALQNLQ